ncbi:hypothetical protein ACFL9S_11005 [Erwinia sp. AnSW2-5]|uniref:hypothetical protein n=1 Tax=Erwinia sp. AnSW2-5 TaxID=3367692 RepID=UPI003858DB7D
MSSLLSLYKGKDKNGTEMSAKKTFLVPLAELYVEPGYNVREIDQAQMAKAKAAGKSKLTKSDAIPQFSARKARRLVELLVDAEFERNGDGDYLALAMDTSDEINRILAEYRAGIGTKDTGEES